MSIHYIYLFSLMGVIVGVIYILLGMLIDESELE